MGKVLQFSVSQSRFVVIMMVIVSNENKIITFRLQCCLDNIDKKNTKKVSVSISSSGFTSHYLSFYVHISFSENI